jgi:hypothetical protein
MSLRGNGRLLGFDIVTPWRIRANGFLQSDILYLLARKRTFGLDNWVNAFRTCPRLSLSQSLDTYRLFTRRGECRL